MNMEAVGSGEIQETLKPFLKSFLEDQENEETRKTLEAVSGSVTGRSVSDCWTLQTPTRLRPRNARRIINSRSMKKRRTDLSLEKTPTCSKKSVKLKLSSQARSSMSRTIIASGTFALSLNRTVKVGARYTHCRTTTQSATNGWTTQRKVS